MKAEPDMHHRRQFVIGLILLIGGLVAIAIGVVFPFTDPVVALGWLLFVPMLVSLCGAVLVFLSLARSTEKVRLSTAVYRITALAAVAGVGLELGYGALGFLSQVPDSLAGQNGAFIPGSAPGLSVFFLVGLGWAAGLVIGAVTALVWWRIRGRHLPPESFARR